MQKSRLALLIVSASALILTSLGATVYAQTNPRASPQGQCGQMMAGMGGMGAMMASMTHSGMNGGHGAMHAQCQQMMSQEDTTECQNMMVTEDMAQCQTMMEEGTT